MQYFRNIPTDTEELEKKIDQIVEKKLKEENNPILQEISIGGKVVAKLVAMMAEKTIVQLFMPFTPEQLKIAIKDDIIMIAR